MKRELNKEYTKNLLVTSAMDLFQIQEYQKTTIDAIVKRAGVSKPTFFAYFKSKEEVLFAFDLKQIEDFGHYMKERLNQQDDLFISLRNSIVYMATNLHKTHMFTQNLMHLVTISEEYKRLLNQMFTIFQSSLEEFLRYGQQHQMIAPVIPADAIAKDITNIYMGSLVGWVISNGSESLDIVLGNALDHYFSGVAK